MKTEQIDLVYTLAEENVITLNGINAEVYPTEQGVLISNDSLTEDEEWDELIVSYPDFITTTKQDGKFKSV